VPGGQWEQEWLDAVRATAAKQGVLWATTADGNAVSRSLWSVRGRAFRPTIDDNKLLGEAELRHQADSLRGVDRQIMAVRGRGGSDLLGALQVAARLFRDYPNRPRNLVLFTDGGITTDGLNLMYRPPETNRARRRLIERLRADGRLPDLSGGTGPEPRVWIGSIGHGTEREMTPEVARNIIAFWEALLPAAHAELVSADSASLRLVDFP
jgi:hypothetical protein